MIGIESPNVTSAARPASLSAAMMSGPAVRDAAGVATGVMVRGASMAVPLNLFDFGPAEDARRHEDQHDGEDREGGHVLVFDREIGRPQRLDEPNDDPAEHGAGQRADAAEHGRRERLDAWNKSIRE